MLVHEPLVGLDRRPPGRVQAGQPRFQLGQPGGGVIAFPRRVQLLAG